MTDSRDNVQASVENTQDVRTLRTQPGTLSVYFDSGSRFVTNPSPCRSDSSARTDVIVSHSWFDTADRGDLASERV